MDTTENGDNIFRAPQYSLALKNWNQVSLADFTESGFHKNINYQEKNIQQIIGSFLLKMKEQKMFQKNEIVQELETFRWHTINIPYI